METRFHAVASAIVSGLVFIGSGSTVATVSAFFVGVLIDIDHIVLACYRHQTLKPITVAIKHAITFSLPEIFDTYPIYGIPILISVHIAFGVILTLIGGIYSVTVAGAIASSLLVHILMDVYDGRKYLF